MCSLAKIRDEGIFYKQWEFLFPPSSLSLSALWGGLAGGRTGGQRLRAPLQFLFALCLKCPRSKRESQGRKREQTGRPIKRAFLAFFHSPLFSLLLCFNAFASRAHQSQFRTLLHHFRRRKDYKSSGCTLCTYRRNTYTREPALAKLMLSTLMKPLLLWELKRDQRENHREKTKKMHEFLTSCWIKFSWKR